MNSRASDNGPRLADYRPQSKLVVPEHHVPRAATPLGRQPRATAALVARHPDRILFGTDEIPFDSRVYAIYFRFLETSDEHFDHDLEDPPPMGRWKISGLGLDGDVLRQVYFRNARHLVPRLTN